MGYKEFTVGSSRFEGHEIKIGIILSIFSVLMAIPLCLLLALGWDTPAYYWANSGNIFTDWQVYYLDFIPIWLIFSCLWLTNKLTPFNLAKWLIYFFLGYWLFYDWAWHFIVMAVSPVDFSWDKPFFFDIIIPFPSMWFFLIIALAGFGLSVVILYVHDKPRHLIPFLLYLGYIYGLGGITEVVSMPIEFYIAWSGTFISAIVATIIYLYFKTIYKKN